MSQAFRLYQPHVYHGKDEVATPDLMVTRMGVALAGDVRPVSVERLTTAVTVSEPAGRCWGAPAAVVVGSSGGALITIGAVHGDLRCLDADPDLALQDLMALQAGGAGDEAALKKASYCERYIVAGPRIEPE